MASDLFEKRLSPEKVFRIIILACLVVTGLAMIYVASHAGRLGPLPENFSQIKSLTSYFFGAFCVFVFFYLQYRWLPRFTRVPLDSRFGYAQALGGAGLIVVGALHIVLPQTTVDVPDFVFFATVLLGEGVFIVNAVWSYTRAGESVPVLPVVGAKPRPTQGLRDESAKDLGWPKSPVKLFGIGAAFFAAGGLLSLVTNFPSFKFPVPGSGEMHFLPFGLLWLSCAVPFVIFAMLYQFFGDSYGLVFEESMTRIHFWLNIVVVLVLVRFFSDWQQAMTSKTWALFFRPRFGWLYLLFFLSALVFAINAYKAYQRHPSRR